MTVETNDGKIGYTSQDYFTAEGFEGNGPVIPIELRKFEEEKKTSLFRKLLDSGVKVEIVGLDISVGMSEAFYLVGFEEQTVEVGPVEGEIDFTFKRIDGKSVWLLHKKEENNLIMKLTFCDLTKDSLRRLLFKQGEPNYRNYLRRILFSMEDHRLELTIGDNPNNPNGKDFLKFISTVQLDGRVEELNQEGKRP